VSGWSLPNLIAGLHDGIEQRLKTARSTMGHPGTKGDASEGVWLELLQTYLPRRYQADKAHVVDSEGAFSEQIDIVIFDRQYSPFVFHHGAQIVVPVESVYAVFEAKQTLNAAQVDYAQNKVASVRRLLRTSLPIPHAGGIFPAKELPWILGGIVALESEWKPPLGDPLKKALSQADEISRLDLGCVASHGLFLRDDHKGYEVLSQQKAATAFLFELIARLQMSATVPMIDIRAYARWL
jgi:hypothetical protein